MSNHIFLGIKTETGPIKRCQLPNYDLQNTVKHLKDEASKQSNLPSDKLEIIYHGHILEDEKSLKESGVKVGETVNVFKKYVAPVPEPVPPITKAETQEFWALCRSLGLNFTTSGTYFSYTMNFLSAMDNSLGAIPAIANNPVAMNILRQPELLFRLLEPETFETVAAKHPIVIRAVNKIFSSLDQSGVLSRDSMASNDRSDSYISMDMDDTDEEIEPMGSDEQRDGATGTMGERISAAITSEQLSLALLYAHRPTSHPSPYSFSRSPRYLANIANRSTSDFSRMIITPDMFSTALSQALVSSNAGESSSSAATSSPIPVPADVESASGASSSGTDTSLLRMREMGLLDDRLNRRALFISNGDVNSAINLVLTGAIEDITE